MFPVLTIIYLIKGNLCSKICYLLLGLTQKYVSVEFNPEQSFYPKALKLNVISSEYDYKTRVGIITDENYYLKISNRSCFGAFIYEVPFTTEPLILFKMDILWGDDSPILLDEISIVIKSDFEDRYIEARGLNKYIGIGILLKHPPEFDNRIRADYVPTNFEWSEKAEKLQPEEHYCLRFFTLNFKRILPFVRLTTSQINTHLEFYRLNAFQFSSKNHPGHPLKTEYLVNVFRCRPPILDKDRLAIYVDPLIKLLIIMLSEENSQNKHIIYLEKNAGRFYRNPDTSNLDFNELKVMSEELTKDMVVNKVGLLLYEKNASKIRCRVRIPENLDHLWFSYIENIYIGTCLADRRILVVDMSTQESNIFRIRLGSKSEIAQCEREQKLK